MKILKLVVLLLLGLNLCCMSPEFSSGKVFLCPPHPDLLERLKKEGRLGELTKVLAKKPKYVDRPLPITTAVIGTRSAVVLLIDFEDKVATTASSHFYNLLLSKGTYPTGSMQDYYYEISYGKLNIDGIISGWYRADNDYNYYALSKEESLVREAINKAAPNVDFSQYDKNNDGNVDLLIVVYAGQGGEEQLGNIWSHMCELSPAIVVNNKYITAYAMCPENGKIGVFSHETGHLLGLPDLYDTGDDSAGIGKWSLMASGSWLGNPQGVTPAHPDAWCKIQLGWVTPNTVTTNINNAQIPQVETSPTVYKLWKDGQPNKEYFLVENRQQIGFDSGLPGSGLLIYHVDERIKDYYLDSNEWNKHQWYPPQTLLPYNHYLVAVEQADGKWNLEKNGNDGDAGDPYYSDRIFNDSSTPNSKAYNDTPTYVGVVDISISQATMTATLQITSLPNPFSLISPTNTTTIATLTVNFKWGTTTAIGGGTVSYTLWYGTDSTFFNNTIRQGSLSQNSYQATLSSTAENKTYYWKVIAKDIYDASSESEIWRFYVNKKGFKDSNVLALPLTP